MSVARLIFYRLVAFMAQFIGAMITIFFIFNIIPYDPVGFFLFVLQPDSQAEQIIIVRSLHAQWNLDKPLLIQVYLYMENLLTNGSFGNSWLGPNLNERFAIAVPYTLAIFGVAVLIYIPLSCVFGIISARQKSPLLDETLNILTLILYGIPYFILGVAAIYFFSDTPLINKNATSGPLKDNLSYIILPTVIIIISFTSYHFRHVKRIISETFTQNYIKTARSKGLTEKIIVYKHALRNGLPEIIISYGVAFPLVLSSIAVIEALFNLPGLGTLLVGAAFYVDWGTVIGLSVLFLLINGVLTTITDVFAYLTNPLADRNLTTY